MFERLQNKIVIMPVKKFQGDIVVIFEVCTSVHYVEFPLSTGAPTRKKILENGKIAVDRAS